MTGQRWIYFGATILLAVELSSCSPQDQKALETQVAILRSTAITEGVHLAETQAVQLKETVQARIATEAAGSITTLVAPHTPGAPVAPTASTGSTYVVISGDTLSGIAKKFNTTMDVLIQLNKDRYPSLQANPNSIQVGWVLRVPSAPTATPSAGPTATPQVVATTPVPIPVPGPAPAPNPCFPSGQTVEKWVDFPRTRPCERWFLGRCLWPWLRNWPDHTYKVTISTGTPQTNNNGEIGPVLVGYDGTPKPEWSNWDKGGWRAAYPAEEQLTNTNEYVVMVDSTDTFFDWWIGVVEKKLRICVQQH